VKIAVADECRGGVGSECGNVRMVHGCLPKRSALLLSWQPHPSQCATNITRPPHVTPARKRPESRSASFRLHPVATLRLCHHLLQSSRWHQRRHHGRPPVVCLTRLPVGYTPHTHNSKYCRQLHRYSMAWIPSPICGIDSSILDSRQCFVPPAPRASLGHRNS
jgi:hypothetical protein